MDERARWLAGPRLGDTMGAMRGLLMSIAAVAVLLVARPAHADGATIRIAFVMINVGDDIIDIRELPEAVTAETGFEKLGYRYQRFGLFELDLWRWGGEYVVYSASDEVYSPVTREQVQALGGARRPWKYRAPPGLLILLAGIELVIMSVARRRASFVLWLGVIWLAVAGVLFLHEVTPAFLIPAVLGLHHVVVAAIALRDGGDSVDNNPIEERAGAPPGGGAASGPPGGPAPLG